MRIQVGCGQSPIPGWLNFDNSPSVKLSRHPALAWMAIVLGFTDRHSRDYIDFARRSDIRFCDARFHIPVHSSSADVVYSSHMMDYLDGVDARMFLAEAMRVLKPGGTLRLALPDLMYYARRYVTDGDLRYFMDHLQLTKLRPRSLREKLKYLIIGDRIHQWMYDGPYLAQFLAEAGYADVIILPAGQTGIPDPGELNLQERSSDSIYVEARRPVSPTVAQATKRSREAKIPQFVTNHASPDVQS